MFDLYKKKVVNSQFTFHKKILKEEGSEAGEGHRLAVVQDHVVEGEQAEGEVENDHRVIDGKKDPHKEVRPV